MQLTLAFIDPPNQSRKDADPEQASIAWDGIDEAARLSALTILARLIVQTLVATREKVAGHD